MAADSPVIPVEMQAAALVAAATLDASSIHRGGTFSGQADHGYDGIVCHLGQGNFEGVLRR